jgi:hypothetical protein
MSALFDGTKELFFDLAVIYSRLSASELKLRNRQSPTTYSATDRDNRVFLL